MVGLGIACNVALTVGLGSDCKPVQAVTRMIIAKRNTAKRLVTVGNINNSLGEENGCHHSPTVYASRRVGGRGFCLVQKKTRD